MEKDKINVIPEYMDNIKKSFLEAQQVLADFVEDEEKLKQVGLAAEILSRVLKNGGKVISCGNGGSMSDAMHFAEELTGRFRGDRPALPAMAISDPTHLDLSTCSPVTWRHTGKLVMCYWQSVLPVIQRTL